MKKTFIFLLAVLLFGCATNSGNNRAVTQDTGIIYKDYNYENTIYETHKIRFEFHLENIKYSQSTAALIEKLIYQNKDFDDYAVYLENKFIDTYVSGFYPPVYYDDGTLYYYESCLVENYYFEYHDEEYIIIYYNYYFYTSGTAHGNYGFLYYIIDIAAEKILTINDLISPVPDSVLIELIREEYEVNYFLRDHIWPPDTINLSKEGASLSWNIYTITPYVTGFVYINLPDENKYLTEKGRVILSRVRGGN